MIRTKPVIWIPSIKSVLNLIWMGETFATTKA